MTRSLDLLNAMLDELVEGVAYDVAQGETPDAAIAMMVAVWSRRPVEDVAEMLGVALLRLAESAQ